MVVHGPVLAHGRTRTPRSTVVNGSCKPSRRSATCAGPRTHTGSLIPTGRYGARRTIPAPMAAIDVHFSLRRLADRPHANQRKQKMRPVRCLYVVGRATPEKQGPVLGLRQRNNVPDY